MCQSYNRQYGTNFIAVMPTNLYGPGDNFDLNSSHVIPALINKFHIAKTNNSKEVIVWGTGKAKREFLHVDDMSEGCIFLMKNFEPTAEQNKTGEIFLNLGSGKDLSIKELAELIKKITDFKGKITWDKSKPDGTPRKLLDVSNMKKMGWTNKISLELGIKNTYAWYLNNLNVRKSKK